MGAKTTGGGGGVKSIKVTKEANFNNIDFFPYFRCEY